MDWLPEVVWVKTENCVSNISFIFETVVLNVSQSPAGDACFATIPFSDNHSLTITTVSGFGDTSFSTLRSLAKGYELWRGKMNNPPPTSKGASHSLRLKGYSRRIEHLSNHQDQSELMQYGTWAQYRGKEYRSEESQLEHPLAIRVLAFHDARTGLQPPRLWKEGREVKEMQSFWAIRRENRPLESYNPHPLISPFYRDDVKHHVSQAFWYLYAFRELVKEHDQVEGFTPEWPSNGQERQTQTYGIQKRKLGISQLLKRVFEHSPLPRRGCCHEVQSAERPLKEHRPLIGSTAQVESGVFAAFRSSEPGK